jgi:hypothetical protein
MSHSRVLTQGSADEDQSSPDCANFQIHLPHLIKFLSKDAKSREGAECLRGRYQISDAQFTYLVVKTFGQVT